MLASSVHHANKVQLGGPDNDGTILNGLLYASCRFHFHLFNDISSIMKIKVSKLPWQVNMKMTPAAHQHLDKSGSKEVLLHSNFYTLACSHQNLLWGIQFLDVLQLFCRAARYIKEKFRNISNIIDQVAGS